ncbi:hypothetical protein [Maribacter aestuarii]|uniref:hypothetical protein n=1 Tax=Maribacter aestuarii TaxID=1130723 RepID=UPI0032215908
MIKKIALFFFISTMAVSAQKNIYESSRFDELSSDHEVLAILPFLTNLELRDDASPEDLKSLEEKEGYAVQDAFETYFSKRKKRKNFRFNFRILRIPKRYCPRMVSIIKILTCIPLRS